MELQLSAISDQVKAIKETMFAPNIDPCSLVAPSAYETAWLAMVPDSHEPSKPMFNDCLNWVLNNQNEQGFWGECDGHGNPTIESLIATLACIMVLKKWNVGTVMINKGLAYFHSPSTKKPLKEVKDHCPCWFAVVFPRMIELALDVGDLKIELEAASSEIFYHRQRIVDGELIIDKYTHYSEPSLSYLEALPSWYDVDEGEIINHLSADGSLFQSPSATVRAFLATGNTKCLSYLQSLAQRCSNRGVPTTFPIDEELIKLCIINHVQRLGLAEHFMLETEQVLEQVYKNYKIMNRESMDAEPLNSLSAIQLQLLKDSLAFRLLRMHGYQVLPRNVCWFLHNEEVRDLIENNYKYFSSVMINVYRATDLACSREFELQDARKFSRKLLEKSTSFGAENKNPFRGLIEHELSLPWMARLDHLEYRIWIEGTGTNNALWQGRKTSFQRLCNFHNDKLVRLAKQNYEFRQFIYKIELEQMKRWSKDNGLGSMGFGREKTTYCYFATAAGCSQLPYDSDVRMIAAKSAILITVADDFFDTKGSMDELRSLVDAIRRWDGKGLCGDGKIIFDALHNLVSEMATKYLKQEESDITSYLRDIWYETFIAWLTESEWGKSDTIPTMDEYLQVGMISVGSHTIVLPTSFYLKPSLPISKLRSREYETLTKQVMIICRLMNDLQGYQKEKDEGSPNAILLYLKKNHEEGIEEAISYVRDLLNKKKEEFLEHVLMDGFSDLPKECRLLHLSCLKVFQMFYNSSNRYDSNTELLDDIAKAIYIPPKVHFFNKLGLGKPQSLPSEQRTTKFSAIKYHDFGSHSKNFITGNLAVHKLFKRSTRIGDRKIAMAPKFHCTRFV